MKTLSPTTADATIRECLDDNKNFYVVAGAGSGKTTSLVTALKYIQDKFASDLRRDYKKIVCITYTNRAVDVISSKLDWDDLFVVSTLHDFVWNQIRPFTSDICTSLKNHIIPAHIEKKRKDDNGGNSKKAVAAREKIAELELVIEELDSVPKYFRKDSAFSDYGKGELGHDDVIAVAANMISENTLLRRLIGQKYPYIFVDEAQDTFEEIITALNKVCEHDGLPLIGYFGDPMQQIYDKRAGNFVGPPGSTSITKKENFRCSPEIIHFLNNFRDDVEQFPAGENKDIQGSVNIRLVESENPESARKRYSIEQLDRVSEQFNTALSDWGWTESTDIKQLFLVRQMIARRLGFTTLHALFTGKYASSSAQDKYESGDHYLLKPFIVCLYPLVLAHESGKPNSLIHILRESSPAFDPKGVNSTKTLGDMRTLATKLIDGLIERWSDNNLREILLYCEKNSLCHIPDRLSEHLAREKREDVYDKDSHSLDKGDWLADDFLDMKATEIGAYFQFFSENTPFSTQHGVKGEEYKNVLVVFDDIEAAWNNYSFSKTLTPSTSGDPTDRQNQLSRKLAYVCFSRAEVNLRILFFTTDPVSAKKELIENGLFREDQFYKSTE